MSEAKFHTNTKLKAKLNIQLQTAKEAQLWVSKMSIPSFLEISLFVPKVLRMIHTQGWTGMTR
jgi:hypothetical protein